MSMLNLTPTQSLERIDISDNYKDKETKNNNVMLIYTATARAQQKAFCLDELVQVQGVPF